MKINGPKIRLLRTRLCLSQEELAVDADVSRRTIQKAENSDPSLSHKVLERIAESLNVEYQDLLWDDDGEPHEAYSFDDWQWRLPKFLRQRVMPIQRAYCRDEAEALVAIERMRANWNQHLDAEKDPHRDTRFRRTDEQLSQDIADYRARYRDIWKANRGTLMYATTDNRRTGISVILPVTDDAYDRLRQGKISFMDVQSSDICLRSPNLILDSAVEFEHTRDRRWFEVANALSFLMFFQIATLAAPIDNHFRMLSFVASRTNFLRLQGIGFSMTNCTMPKYDLAICEFQTSHSESWSELDERVSNTAHFTNRYRHWSTAAKLRAKRKLLMSLFRSYQWMLGISQRSGDSAA